MPKKKEYIANYGEWHFESYWNEYTESWSVYQSEETESGYVLRCHCFMTKPVKNTKEAKERVENWLKLLPIIEKARNDHERRSLYLLRCSNSRGQNGVSELPCGCEEGHKEKMMISCGKYQF